MTHLSLLEHQCSEAAGAFADVAMGINALVTALLWIWLIG